MQYFTANLTLLITALKKIAHHVVKDFNELTYLNLSNHTNNTFASKINSFIEGKIIADIKKIKPEYSYILNTGEIIENKDNSNYVVVSNINSFANFVKGIPFFSISLALIRDNKPFAAVVYQPIVDQLYFAEVNRGAFLNKIRLKNNSSRVSNHELLVATNHSDAIPPRVGKVRCLISGCPALELCYLASLKLDLCVYNNHLNYYDILPALIIAQEAGHMVTYTKNENIISNLIGGSVNIRESFDI